MAGRKRSFAAHITSYIEHLKKKKLSDTTIKRHLSVIHRLLVHYDNHATSSEHVKTYRASPLKQTDFISNKEMHRLLKSMKRPIDSAARDILSIEI